MNGCRAPAEDSIFWAVLPVGGAATIRSPLGEVPNSDYKSLGGSLKIGYTPDLGQRFELTFRKYSETDGRAGGVGGAPGAPFLIRAPGSQ